VTTPEISVIIPTYRRPEMVRTLLLALAGQTLAHHRFEVVVVDDCSPDDTAEVLEKMAADVPFSLRVVRTPRNGGPAVARNLGWQVATAPLLAFIDDDCDPAPGWLDAGRQALLNQPEAGVIQGRSQVPAGASVAGKTDWYIWRVIEGPTPFFEGLNIFFRRAAFELTGGFDEEIAYHGEDSAAGWRVVEAGFAHGYCDEAVVTHPIEQRGFSWHIEMGLLEARIVQCAAKHPGFRQQAFWRPWAYRREDPAFLLALVGLVVGLRFRPALLLLAPYLWWQRPSVRRLSFFRLCWQVPTVDAVRMAAHLKASLRYKVLVL
jgi:GT2 family glycosyltransferase